MKNFLFLTYALVLILLFNACAAINTQKQTVVNENLPVINELKHISSINSIAFEWKSLYNEDIEGFYLYRGGEQDTNLELIATIKNKYKTHFVDTNLEPNTKYYYAMKSFNKEGHISKEGVVVEAKTSTRIVSLPFVQALSGLPNKIKLIWRPHPDLRVHSYVIERADNMAEFKYLAEVKNRLSAEYIDENLKPNQNFQYRIFAKTFDGVYSESSEIVNSTTKDLPPQVHISSVSDSLPNVIRITWDNPEFKDLAYYKIYARSSILPFTNIAKTNNLYYEDVINEVGKTKEYKVTIVDKDGLESPIPSDAVRGSTLGAPAAPSIVASSFTGSAFVLSWVDNDDRARSYVIKRYGGAGDVEFKDIRDKSFTDTTITVGQNYRYEVIAIDEFNIASQPSKPVSISR